MLETSNTKTNLFFSPLGFLILSLIVTIGLLFCLIIHEVNSAKEMQHIVGADFKTAILQSNLMVSQGPAVTTQSRAVTNSNVVHRLQIEMNSHLIKKIRTTYYVIAAILFIIFLLTVTWIFISITIHRLKKLKSNESRLEELLYYDQVKKIQHYSHFNKTLSPALMKLQQNRKLFSEELKHGLEKNQFVLHYQPIVSAENNKIIDIEALIRWQHPEYGLLSPDIFLPLCETTGFIVPLGEWIIRTACEQAKQWHEMGYKELSMAVNLSARQFNHAELLTVITQVLESSGLPPACLKLEITESMIMQNIESNIKLLNKLRNLGLQLALDDFGTGYSSFTYLKKFPFSIIKIDKSFIADLSTNITSIGIVESIIALGKSLGLTLVAEGVETETQLFLLKKMQCDMFQGYLYSKPVPAEELTQLLFKSDTMVSPHGQEAHQYQYKILQHEHYEQAVKVITRTFCGYEPMTKYLGITHQDFIPFAKLMVEKAIKDGLSIVALEGGNVTSCTIVEDMADPLQITINIDPRFKVIFSLLAHLGSNFFPEKNIEKGHLAHLVITAVDQHYFGKGLSKKINFESIKLAKKKNFDFMCCEFTHRYNEKGTVKNLINSKLLIRSCQYKDFIFEGKKPFEHLEGSASAYIWELRSEAKLRYKILSS